MVGPTKDPWSARPQAPTTAGQDHRLAPLKSEILRALIRLADTKPAINGALQDTLDRRPRE
ncbi:hypothetical protein [Streptomyces sp. NPDC087511]|uniref:hypothetical protein n=1 Tax=Streptomyces sp. NPDC087511 TaxID=3365792 RepID=UPI00380061BE